jgi:hypothetical protein
MDIEELPAYLDALRIRVNFAGRAASDGMVAAFDRGIKSNELIRTTGHPSPPGSPPALETGRLRGSFHIKHAVEAGPYRWLSSDGPDTIYANIQEYGGDIWAKHTYVDKRTGITRPGFLRWGGPGGYHFARHVHLPKRPYMHPAVHRMTGDGTLRRGAVSGFNHFMGFD